MGRKTKSDYMKITRKLFDKEYNLSRNAIYLFVWLNELEQIFTEDDGGRDWFTHTDKEISERTGMCLGNVKKAKRELVEKGFIETSRGNWHFVSTGKSSIRQPTVYRIIR